MMGNNDKLIEERTEARAEAFRAQERVRELEELLGDLGAALHAVDVVPDFYSPTFMSDHSARLASVDLANMAIVREAKIIATRRREGK